MKNQESRTQNGKDIEREDFSPRKTNPANERKKPK